MVLLDRSRVRGVSHSVAALEVAGRLAVRWFSRWWADRYEALSHHTRVPQAAYFREAVEDLLKKYEEPKKKAGK